MQIVVNDNKVISVVEHEFHEKFPYLRLEFVKINYSSTTADKNRVTSDKTFSSFGGRKHPERIMITSSMTVHELVGKFRDQYELDIKIFRKSGKLWLKTSLTDHWTLHEQNEQGKALSS